MLKKILFASAIWLADLFLFAQTPFAQTVATPPTPTDSPRTAAEAGAQFAPESLAPVDLSLYFSPTKIIAAKGAERILNTDEWTNFYLSSIRSLDAKRFATPEKSELAAQLKATFADAEPSFNLLFDALFGSCQAIWLDLALDSETLKPDFASFSCVFVSNFPDASLLVVAALTDAGYAEFPRTREMGAPRRFGRAETPEIFLAEAPTAENSELFVGFLARTAEEATAQKEAFAAGTVFAERLRTDDATLATARLTASGIEKVRRFFADAPQSSPESLRAAWAPGVVELANRLDAIEISAREKDGVAEIETVFATQNAETAQDLTKFAQKAKTALENWTREAETTPFQEFGATLVVGSETSVVDETNFVLKYRFAEPEIFDKIQQCFENAAAER